MAIYKIKRFSKFARSTAEDLCSKLPIEYQGLQRMAKDPTLKSEAKKAKYLKKEFEYPYFELIPWEEWDKKEYENSWTLPIMYIDSMKTPVYFNFKKEVWQNFQGLEIKNLKAYLWNNWNDCYLDWENGDFDEYLEDSEMPLFQKYTRTLVKSTKRYL